MVGGLDPARRLLRGSLHGVSIQNNRRDDVVSPTVVPIQLTAARIDDASGPAGASRNHDTRRLHAIAPGLVGLTIERAEATSWMQLLLADARTWTAECG